jgi:hypothetical protein
MHQHHGRGLGVARHSRVIASIRYSDWNNPPEQDTTADSGPEGRLIECFFSVITRQAIRRGSFRSGKELTGRHRRVHRHLEPERQAVRLDEGCRRDPRQDRTREH